MHDLGDTVAAISTPPGKGGVALIRVSGADAFAICDRVFFPKNGRRLSEILPKMQIYGDIYSQNEPIDDGMAVRMEAPHTYTGENTVEITCHGGVRLTAEVLSSVLAAGARMAQPGEFTRRACVNGRLTLTDAEAIGALLEAKSLSQIRLSRRDARDRLSEKLDAIRSSAVGVMSSMLARIDYPDEDLGDLTDEQVLTMLREQLASVDALLSTYRTGHAIMEGVRTVICGKPNVGKSALYNALVGEDAAIVTDIAGTTRDVLERTVPHGSVTLRLLDTAGLRDTDDPVECIGVERTKQALAFAELVLAVFDTSRPMDAEDEALIRRLKENDAPRIAVLNKRDLPPLWDASVLSDSFDAVVSVSARAGEIDALSRAIDTLFADERMLQGDGAVVTTARQQAALVRARDALSASVQALELGLAQDAAASDLSLAIGALGELSGREVSEAVVADIFSKFCVGK